ncbi:carbohydrate-binding protein [Chitinibacteraceae bacterium HSL-7]
MIKSLIPLLAFASVSAAHAAPLWQEGQIYAAGQVVTYKQVDYTALVSHTAFVGAGWTPEATPTLWQALAAPAPQTPVQVAWKDFNGKFSTLYAWEGNNVAVLARQPDLNADSMKKLVSTLDNAYNFYQQTTGYTPNPYILYNGKLSIADVAETCGAGCGYIGYTGIELQHAAFDIFYNALHKDSQYDQTVFYELGRNFWGFGSQLEYKAPDQVAPVVTGFAVFMRNLTMESLALAGAPVNGTPLGRFNEEMLGLIDRYEADPSLNWSNTLAADRAPANTLGLGGADLFSSMMFRLQRDYGGYTFVKRFWDEVRLRPAATTTQEAVDNFFLAASHAAKRNLTTQFVTRWRIPVSDAAQASVRVYTN